MKLMMKLFTQILFIGILICSCEYSTSEKPLKKTLSNYEKLVQFCNDKNQNISRYRTIIVINEIGTCINCNNIFSRSQGKNLNSDSTLFIVSGVGNKVDLSAYVDRKAPNLILDDSAGFDSLNIVKSCAIISLSDNKINSVEEINVNNVNGLSERRF